MKIWLSLKKYWHLICAFIFFAFGLFLFRRSSGSISDRLREIDVAHKNEIARIEAARLKEKKLREESEKKYRETLELVKRQYDLEKAELTDKKQKEIKKIMNHHGNDPQELAHQLSKATGFRVVLPED